MQAGPRSEEVGFAHDSALEGSGFEPSVPLRGRQRISRLKVSKRAVARGHRIAAAVGLTAEMARPRLLASPTGNLEPATLDLATMARRFDFHRLAQPCRVGASLADQLRQGASTKTDTIRSPTRTTFFDRLQP
jgi:hypothetical protein